MPEIKTETEQALEKVQAELVKASANKKARYWTVVMYPENMKPNWKEDIGELLQRPYAYCVHDGDKDGKDDERKEHVHIIIAFSNTTTYKNVMSVFSALNADGKKAFNTVQVVSNIRYMYDYLIHDTEDSKKKKKKLYDKSERITGNNFDIGNYEQISGADKDRMLKEVISLIREQKIDNFAVLMYMVTDNLGDEYIEIFKGYSGLLYRLCDGQYQLNKRSEGVLIGGIYYDPPISDV